MTTQARELAGIISNAGDLNFSDDITLGSDGAVLNFGADSDVTVTHVHNTGLILNSTRQLQFGDSGTYINQSADGVLNLTSDTEVEINATTVDINANVDISGDIVLGGTITVGDADTDNMIINANVNSHIIPNTDDTYDLGSTGQQWRNLYIDGTVEADAITIGGVTLSETIADTVGAMTTSNTESGITVAYDDGDNTLDFTVGTLNQDTTGTASLFTASANNSTDETVYPVFVDGATGSQGAETDTGLTYNPSTGMLTSTGVTATFTGNITGNVTGNTSGTAATVTTAAQSSITSLGTLTALTVDNLGINGNTITANSGALNLTPAGGSAIVLDGTINVDAGVVTGATSITSTAFVGALTGNASGTALTVTQAAQTAITSVGTLTGLTGGTGDLIWDTPTFVVDSSTNRVGIGITSPATKIDVRGTSASAEAVVQIVGTGVSTLMLGQNAIGGVIRGQGGSDAALQFRTGSGAADNGIDAAGTERMRITGNGNVGIGAVPKATETGWTNVSIGGLGTIINSTSANASGRTQLANNVYVDTDGNYSYISTDEASLYKQIDGIHSWHNAASGSADAHISMSERMRIGATGKTSWSAGGIGAVATQARDFTFYTEGGTNGVAVHSNDHRLVFMGGAGSSGAGMDAGYLQLEVDGTAKIAFNSAGDSYFNGSGNVGIGIATPNEGGFGSTSNVLSIAGTAQDAFGVLELISTDVTSSNRIGEIRFGNLDAGSSFASNAGIRATRDGADNSSALSLWYSNAGTFTEGIRIASAGQLGIGGANYGSDGQVLTSTGASSAPAWEAAGGAVSGLTNNSNATWMTVDSSENVGIGTASPATRLHVFQTEGGVGADHATIRLGGYTTTGVDITAYRHDGNSNNQGFSFKTYDATNGSVQRLRINPTGGFLIKGSHQGDTIGNLNVSSQVPNSPNTSENCLIIVENGGQKVQMMAWSGLGARVGTRTGGWSSNSGGNCYLTGQDAACLVLKSDGVAYLANGSTAVTSDVRLKKNITDLADGQLAIINALTPRNFEWKDTRKTGTQTGLIAQEVESVISDATTDTEFAPDPDDTSRDFEGDVKIVKYGDINIRLLKAVQELSAELTAAKARITSLEG